MEVLAERREVASEEQLVLLGDLASNHNNNKIRKLLRLLVVREDKQLDLVVQASVRQEETALGHPNNQVALDQLSPPEVSMPILSNSKVDLGKQRVALGLVQVPLEALEAEADSVGQLLEISADLALPRAV